MINREMINWNKHEGEAPVQYRLLAEEPKTYALIFETGEELAAGLGRFAAEQNLAGSSFKAIGLSLPANWLGSTGKLKSISRA